jgi:hypothetical protein
MTGLVLVRWVASGWFRQPWKWAAILVLIALWPALQVFTPFGVTSGGAQVGLPYELAFVAAIVGSACALDALDVLPACARTLGISTSWPAEWIAVVLATVAVQTVVLALPIAAAGLSRTDLLDVASRAGLHAAWLSGIAVALLRIRMPHGSRPIVFLLATWVLPALAPSAVWSSALGASPDSPSHDVALRTIAASRVAAVSALLLAVHLVDAHRARRT